MKLLTKAIESKLPKLNTTDETALAICKFFTPDSSWTWYATEYDPVDKIFFGLVDGFEIEYGNFGLKELEEVRGHIGLPIERDLYFTPKPVEEIRKKLLQQRSTV